MGKAVQKIEQLSTANSHRENGNHLILIGNAPLSSRSSEYRDVCSFGNINQSDCFYTGYNRGLYYQSAIAFLPAGMQYRCRSVAEDGFSIPLFNFAERLRISLINSKESDI